MPSPFNSQDLICNFPYCLPNDSHYVSLENLVPNQFVGGGRGEGDGRVSKNLTEGSGSARFLTCSCGLSSTPNSVDTCGLIWLLVFSFYSHQLSPHIDNINVIFSIIQKT